MDNEVFDKLKKYDVQFKSMRDSSFCRLPGTPSLTELDECYRKIFNRPSRLLNACSSCIYSCLKELSVVYFIELQVRNETEPKDVTTSVSTEKKTVKTKTATNKSKKKK